MLREEREGIIEGLGPNRCFTRGIMLGLFSLQGLQLVTPDVLQVWDWPIWLRAVVGVASLVLALHYLMQHRGYSLMNALSHSPRIERK